MTGVTAIMSWFLQMAWSLLNLLKPKREARTLLTGCVGYCYVVKFNDAPIIY
jgi:hypothetical protein